MKGFYNFIKFLFGWIVLLIYPVKIVGNKKNVPKSGKAVIISNHMSFRDIPVLVMRFPGYRHFLAKKEFTKNKLVKWFFDKMGVFYVDRDNLDMNAIRTGLNYLKNDEAITMFPEGTRNKTDENIQKVKGGAAMFAVKGKAPLIPVIFQRKIKPFRRTYIYVGEPIPLENFYGSRFDAAALNAASAMIGERMEADKSYIDDYYRSRKNKNKKIEGSV